MKQTTTLFFLSILLVASVLRLWQLGMTPVSPDWDEVALGYNAYSILKTGRDEYGTKFPLSLRSYDDYKPPLYMYVTIPFVALFGLETWAVRLPSALAGILAVYGTYLLTKELFSRKDLALVASLLLALSPWHIQFSRIAFEANLGVALNIFATYCFLKGLINKRMFLFSAFLFGLSLYAYHSERIFVPILVVLLVVIYRKHVLVMRRHFLYCGIVGIVTALPLFSVFMNQSTLTRLRGTSSLADQTGLLARTVAKLEKDGKDGNAWGLVFDNRRLVWFKTLVDGYLAHYSMRWLFLTGDNPRHHAPDMGLLYIIELPFFLFGMYQIGKQKDRGRILLFSWFLIAPIAASPTTELPHAIRTLVFLPTFQIFSAAGVIAYASIMKEKYSKGIAVSILLFTLLCFMVNIAYYLHMYFGHMNHEYSKYWQYGYKEAAAYAQQHRQDYDRIVVSTRLEQPHMFFLFFLKYDPVRYLAEGGTASGGFAERKNRFDIYEFRPIDWDGETKNEKTLFIGTPKEIPQATLATIFYLNGDEAIRIASR